MEIKQIDKAYIAGTYARFPLEIVSGKGSLVYDENGKEYIDLGTGIAVNTFGVSDDKWVAAVTEQLTKCQHTSNLFYSAPCAMLAQALCERTGMKRVFFSNSGAEANETAIKVARKWAADNKGAEYNTIITLKNSFHGRTITTLAATGQDVFHEQFLPLTPGFVYADANDLASVESLVKEYKVAAIMFELIQGEGGVLPLSAEFVAGLRKLAEEENILLVCDEVQTGNGRTGELYAFQNYDFLPDIASTAKGLGGGLPIGACMLGEKVKDTLTAGSHGSTFGGNPIAAAGACNILSRIDDKLLAEVREKSAYIFSEFENAKGVKSVSGLGLMIGIETEKDASEVITTCRENGVLVIKAKQKVRLLPALNIPMNELKKAVEVIKAACAEYNMKTWNAHLLDEDAFLKLKPNYPVIRDSKSYACQYFFLEKENDKLLLCRDDIGLSEVHSAVLDEQGYSLIAALWHCYAVNHSDFSIRFAKPLETPCIGIAYIHRFCYVICEAEIWTYDPIQEEWNRVLNCHDAISDYDVQDDILTIELFDGSKIPIMK